MKRMLAMLLTLLLLTGCGTKKAAESAPAKTTAESASGEIKTGVSYPSRFHAPTVITLSDDGNLVDRLDSGADEDAVAVTHDIIYYEDRDAYDSGNPYGEGTEEERHNAEEAAAHTVVNIRKPGAYRVNGKLSKGQIRIDLGEDAKEDPNAVVELILDNADLTCTVAPAILFLNVYECDEDASEDTATADVDTSSAGANLILEGHNTVNGSHVAKIFKDKDGEKKLWKQDGAIYSYMSMNVFGPGSLELTADNEGLGTEMHLTVNGGDLTICSGNDGINTNEDGVSVTTINGGKVTVFAGLGKEGDGIDSNGYLVINGGTVLAAAHPASDAGLDSDLGSFIHGGTVIAMGSTMDWAESDSRQVTMNLQFAGQQKAGTEIRITTTDGTEYLPFQTDSDYARPFSGLILSHPGFIQGATYHVYADGVQMSYTGTDVKRGPGGMPFPKGHLPEGMDPASDFDPGQREDRKPPEDPDPEKTFDLPRPDLDNRTPPENFGPAQFYGEPEEKPGEAHIDFYMRDKVNAFSGVTTAE